MIYCVEDDTNIRELVVYTLENTGFQVRGFVDGESFFQGLKDALPDLILLDIMLPNEDGLSILNKLKTNSDTRDIPVIMVTAKGSEYDQIKGLDSGADDYITKPFGMMALVSRIKAVLRRSGAKAQPSEITIGDLTLNSEKHVVIAEGKEVRLTLKEFELLNYLMENKGIVLTRDSILDSIWGYDLDCETRTVDVHIRTIRQKLGACGDLIETVRGVGYRMGGAK